MDILLMATMAFLPIGLYHLFDVVKNYKKADKNTRSFVLIGFMLFVVYSLCPWYAYFFM